MNVPHLERIEERMRPGALSVAGFLGPKESLIARIAADRAEIERLGVTTDQIADRFEGLLGRALRRWELSGSDDACEVGGGYRVRILAFAGFQECPFLVGADASPCPVRTYGSLQVDIDGPAGRMSLPGLGVHLIRDHGFFEGNTPFRMPPADLVRVLGVAPGVDYTPARVEEVCWSFYMGIGPPIVPRPSWFNRLAARIERLALCDEEIEIAPGIRAFVFGDGLTLVASASVDGLAPVCVGGAWLRVSRIGRGWDYFHRTKRIVVVG